MEAIWDVLSSEVTYSSAVRFAALLLFAACGEWVAERAGTLNISVEGMILAGAFAAAVGYDRFGGSVAAGLVAGCLAGVLIASVQANMSHRLPADQFVVGLTLNILVLGLVGFLDAELDPTTQRVATTEIPLLSELPLLGPALFAQPWPLYLVYPLVPLVWWLTFRTRWGLEVRAAGEDPNAADVSGLKVNQRRREAIYLAGLTSGLGGGYLVLGAIGAFEDSIVGGRGFIAIAAVIFGGWTLRGTVAGCVLFGAVVSFRLSLPQQGYDSLNTELLSALPYLVTILGMALFAHRIRPPAALARPFLRGLK
ncbi:MAG: ABC transporter permease [Actinomycetota bacterium]